MIRTGWIHHRTQIRTTGMHAAKSPTTSSGLVAVVNGGEPAGDILRPFRLPVFLKVARVPEIQLGIRIRYLAQKYRIAGAIFDLFIPNSTIEKKDAVIVDIDGRFCVVVAACVQRLTNAWHNADGWLGHITKGII